jgi:hypothetical protein
MNRDQEAKMQVKMIVLAVTLPVVPGLMYAQFNFNMEEQNVQLDSSGPQNLAYLHGNNYLTMETSASNISLTDGATNVSSRVADQFRVGQGYMPYLGDPSEGVSAGKVRTAPGLYTDTYRTDFLHAWAPPSRLTYPIELRTSTSANVGGDFYGTVSPRQLDSAPYTPYSGMRQDDPQDALPTDSRTEPTAEGDVAVDSLLTQQPRGSGIDRGLRAGGAMITREPPVRHPNGKNLWRVSLAALAAANAADIQSSWGKRELNQNLAQNDSTFGLNGSLIKLGILTSVCTLDYLVLHRRSTTAIYRKLAFVNLGDAMLTGAMAIRNYGIPKQ